jgi:peptidoglycan/LPS O-acetylase OafA/YrhL
LLVFALGTWYQDAVAWQIVYLGWGDGGHHNPYLQPRNWQNLLAHLTLTFGLFPQYANSLNLPDWSIGSEVQFYALFPFLLRWVKRSPIAVTVGLVALAVLLRVSHVFPSEPSLFFLKAPQYLIGMLTAGALHHRWRTLWLAGTVATIQSEYWQQPGILLFVVCLLAIAHRSSEAKTLADRYLGNKFMAFLATTSYGVYLLHGFCIIGYSRLLDSDWYYSQPKAFHGIATLILTLVTVYPLAWLSYQWIERPFLQMGRSNPAKPVRDGAIGATN